MNTETPPKLDQLLAQRAFLTQLALRLATDESQAEDIAQETWLRALTSPPRHGRNVRAWLAAIARNVARREAGRRARLPRGAEDEAELGPASAGEKRRVLRSVGVALLALDEPYRHVLLLRFFEDKSPARIAAELQRPVNTVLSQIRRGLERLRAELDGRYGEDPSWRALVLAAAPPARRAPRAPPAPRRCSRKSGTPSAFKRDLCNACTRKATTPRNNVERLACGSR
ncbi:MAG: sigma-70 family RNA polymerase sigma factor [Planctomycetota bacterium]